MIQLIPYFGVLVSVMIKLRPETLLSLSDGLVFQWAREIREEEWFGVEVSFSRVTFSLRPFESRLSKSVTDTTVIRTQLGQPYMRVAG
jgi:hypothetical protein